MSDHCPQCNRYLSPGASDCASCGYVLGEEVRSPQRSNQHQSSATQIALEDDLCPPKPSAISTFFASCMVLFGGILFVAGCIMAMFSFTVGAIVGGARSSSLDVSMLFMAIFLAVIGYFITKGGLIVIDRRRIR